MTIGKPPQQVYIRLCESAGTYKSLVFIFYKDEIFALPRHHGSKEARAQKTISFRKVVNDELPGKYARVRDAAGDPFLQRRVVHAAVRSNVKDNLPLGPSDADHLPKILASNDKR